MDSWAEADWLSRFRELVALVALGAAGWLYSTFLKDFFRETYLPTAVYNVALGRLVPIPVDVLRRDALYVGTWHVREIIVYFTDNDPVEYIYIPPALSHHAGKGLRG